MMLQNTPAKRAHAKPLVSQNGTLALRRLGVSFDVKSDTYHFIMGRPWWQLLSLLFVAYLAVSLFYAVLYKLGGDCISGTEHNGLLEYYFFSVQTLATIGYGHLVPVGIYANAVVSLEAFTGLLSFALMSSLMFAKFSVPSARVMFSKFMVMTRRDGKQALVFRLGNARGNSIIEAHCNVTMVRVEPTEVDPNFRRLHKLALVVADSPLFALTFQVTHLIDESSPMWGVSAEEMQEQNYAFMVTMMGLDGLLSQTVHARYNYSSGDIAWNHRFVDTIVETEDGETVIDYNNFHLVEPLAS
jgi:inward rectifier potassium channel